MLNMIVKLGAGMTAQELGAFVRLLHYQQVHGGWEPERIPLITGLNKKNAQALHKHMLTHCISIAQALHKHYCPQFAEFLEEKKSEKSSRTARAKKAALARWGDKATEHEPVDAEIILIKNQGEKKEKKILQNTCAYNKADVFFSSIDQRNSIQGGTGGDDVQTSNIGVEPDRSEMSVMMAKLSAAFGTDRVKPNKRGDMEQGIMDALRWFMREMDLGQTQAFEQLIVRASAYRAYKEATGETKHYLHSWLAQREFENLMEIPKPSGGDSVKQTAAQIAAELRKKRNAGRK